MMNISLRNRLANGEEPLVEMPQPRIALLLLATSAIAMCSSAAYSEELAALKGGSVIQQAASMLHYQGGNDRLQIELAPNWSDELGFSMRGAVGTYLSDEIALGLIVEYGENKREYLANVGIQFTDQLSLVGSIGQLQEDVDFNGEGRDEVKQMEYGASLRGTYDVGILSSVELNGYLTNANSTSVETGRLYGVQLLTDLDLTDTTHLKLGGGYEWLQWEDTEGDDNSFTFSAEAAQQITDTLSLNAKAKLGASEYVYGAGLALDLGNGGLNTNMLGVSYNYIDGKNGVQNDQRVELVWTLGFGAGSNRRAATTDLKDSTGSVQAAADVAMVSPTNHLLGDVMKRPSFLPSRAIARAAGTLDTGIACSGAPTFDYQGYGIYDPNIRIYVVLSSGEPIENFAWKLVEVDGTTTSINLTYGGSDPGPYNTGEPFLMFANGNADGYDLSNTWTLRGVYTGPSTTGFETGCFILNQTED